MPVTLPSPADRAVLETQLAEARTRLHQIELGLAPTEVVTQGDVVKFNRANADELRAYISQLEARLAGRPLAGAIGMVWSR